MRVLIIWQMSTRKHTECLLSPKYSHKLCSFGLSFWSTCLNIMNSFWGLYNVGKSEQRNNLIYQRVGFPTGANPGVVNRALLLRKANIWFHHPQLSQVTMTFKMLFFFLSLPTNYKYWKPENQRTCTLHSWWKSIGQLWDSTFRIITRS